MEGDFCQYASGFTLCHFNPLPPHGGRRSHSEIGRNHSKDFNPLPPHGGRPSPRDIRNGKQYFNPLPPHGGRRFQHNLQLPYLHFNPLPPHGGRRSFFTLYLDKTNISIHSLRMEGDMSSATYFPAWYIFQSTPSAWRETQLLCNVHYFNIFQSTPSAWRETSHRR